MFSQSLSTAIFVTVYSSTIVFRYTRLLTANHRKYTCTHKLTIKGCHIVGKYNKDLNLAIYSCLDVAVTMRYSISDILISILLRDSLF